MLQLTSDIHHIEVTGTLNENDRCMGVKILPRCITSGQQLGYCSFFSLWNRKTQLRIQGGVVIPGQPVDIVQ